LGGVFFFYPFLSSMSSPQCILGLHAPSSDQFPGSVVALLY